MLWLTKKKINQVRNNILNLCLEPGQKLKVASAYYGVPFVELTVQNGSPVFIYKIFSDPKTEYVFHMHRDRWMMHIRGEEFTNAHGVPFRDKRAHVVWQLVKAYAYHFPFVATDNYFLRNGQAI